MARSKKAAPAKAAPPKAAAATGRGSPEAIQKRRVARRLNDILTGRGATGAVTRDGRTEKRRRRLLSDLEKATKKGAKALKPIELLQRIQALLEMGEPISSIRKVAKVRPNNSLTQAEAVAILKDVHASYSFRPEAYLFLGLPNAALIEARLLTETLPRRGRPPKHRTT